MDLPTEEQGGVFTSSGYAVRHSWDPLFLSCLKVDKAPTLWDKASTLWECLEQAFSR